MKTYETGWKQSKMYKKWWKHTKRMKTDENDWKKSQRTYFAKETNHKGPFLKQNQKGPILQKKQITSDEK